MESDILPGHKKGAGSQRPGLRGAHPLVGILGGSKSDFPILEKAVAVLSDLAVPNELLVVSAHRTPDRLFAYAEQAAARGIEVIIAGAGGAAHLPGMLAAKTHLPVIGVPIPTENLRGLDSLLSIVQMPRGIPVATVAIGGAENAGLLAAQILAGRHPEIASRVKAFRKTQTDSVLNSPEAKGTVDGASADSRSRRRS
jgi:phosphoribosylaminoimidazole carboxylase PurE protein